ncbi:interleukin-3-like [Rhinolophus ferrumequinum]|uniref:interleukin-3-like n=1 Tax=Rhinolophus ferrumequinum TaxID=59479 RepID=UPI00140FDB48|nr:interleukin-3-like [Rhinolophus ferrumequinum]
MSSRPILHVFLLLLTLHAPRAQAQPIRQSRQLTKNYANMMAELETILNNPTVPPPQNLDSNEIYILMQGNLRLNMDAFLKAARNFKDERQKIVKILEEFKKLLPTPTTTVTAQARCW